MAINIRFLTVLATITAAIALMATAAFAAPKTDNTRPGWGYGDKNHVHTGPPGQSVRAAQ